MEGHHPIPEPHSGTSHPTRNASPYLTLRPKVPAMHTPRHGCHLHETLGVPLGIASANAQTSP